MNIDWRSRLFARSLVANHASTYLVGLHVCIEQHREEKDIFYTGFVATIANRPIWVTAGHCIDEIWSIIRDGNTKIINAQFVDGHHASDAGCIPISLPEITTFSGTSRGVDIGLLALSPMYWSLLQANGRTKFVQLDPDEPVTIERPVGHYIVGSPAESLVHANSLSSVKRSVRINRYALPLELGLSSTPIPGTEISFWNHENDVYGKILDYSDATDRPVENIRGMSGGPVFAVSMDEHSVRVELIGVQSAWLPVSRIVRIATLSELYQLVTADLGK